MGVQSRVRRGQHVALLPSVQINTPVATNSTPDNFDGRSNMEAGTKPGTAGSRGEMQVQSPAKPIQTY